MASPDEHHLVFTRTETQIDVVLFSVLFVVGYRRVHLLRGPPLSSAVYRGAKPTDGYYECLVISSKNLSYYVQ